MAKILNLIIFMCRGVIRMFEVIERMAGGNSEPDVSVTPDTSQDIDIAAIVQRIERLEQTVAELSAKPEENPDEKTEEIVEEKTESEENEE